MPKPLLHLRDVGSVFERVRCCGCSERVRPEGIDTDADRFRVVHDDVSIDRIAREGLLDFPVGPANRSEESTFRVATVPGSVEVVLEKRECLGMHGRVAELPALAVYGERHDAAPLREVLNLERTQLGASKPLVEEDG